MGSDANGSNRPVLHGGHIIRVISAAELPKDLHNDQLRIRCDTLHQDGIQRLGIRAVSIGNIAVCRRNAFHMAAVLPLGIAVVVHIKSGVVHIVITIRDL